MLLPINLTAAPSIDHPLARRKALESAQPRNDSCDPCRTRRVRK